jgi:hypothetical protein
MCAKCECRSGRWSCRERYALLETLEGRVSSHDVEDGWVLKLTILEDVVVAWKK